MCGSRVDTSRCFIGVFAGRFVPVSLSPTWRTLIGTSLGPYKIIERLGAGGMGEVCLGEDTRLDRKVAIIKWRQNES